MIKLLLVFVNPDLYAYGNLRLQATATSEDEINHYKPRFLKAFKEGKYSEMHLMTLELDPANGTTSVLENEYMTIPLKTKTIINAEAAKSVRKSSPAVQMLMEEDHMEGGEHP